MAAGRRRARRCVPAAAGKQSEADLRDAEPGAVAGDPQVAGEGQLEAAAERQPVDGGDARLG